MTRSRVESILKDITYLDWKFAIGESNGRLYLQVNFWAPDADTGLRTIQKGRKWFLSEFMVRQEIVRTVYKAIEAAVQHEMDENFKLCGKCIYGPHIDPYALLTVADITEGRT